MEDWLAQRVLAHVPTQQQHESVNAVLQEEFAAVSHAVNDVAAAFGKLEEVRDAVSQLERSPGSRSASLMAATANAMLLQREIGEKVGRLATGMKVARLDRKRKREEEVVSQETGVTNSRVRTNSVKSNGERDDAGLLEQAREACAESRATGGTTQVGNGNLELSVSSAKSSSESDDEAGSEDDGEAVMESKGLGVKSERSSGGSNQGALNNNSESIAFRHDDCGETRGQTAQASGEPDDELESGDDDGDEVEGSEAAWKALMNAGNASLSKTLNEQSSEQDFEPEKPANHATGHALKKSATYLKRIVEDVNRLSKQDRAFIIPDILIALKESVEDDEDATQQAEVASSLNILIGWWAAESGEQIHHLKLYRAYAEAVKTYGHLLPKSARKVDLQR
jgi:hypothetical protein